MSKGENDFHTNLEAEVALDILESNKIIYSIYAQKYIGTFIYNKTMKESKTAQTFLVFLRE